MHVCVRARVGTHAHARAHTPFQSSVLFLALNIHPPSPGTPIGYRDLKVQQPQDLEGFNPFKCGKLLNPIISATTANVKIQLGLFLALGLRMTVITRQMLFSSSIKSCFQPSDLQEIKPVGSPAGRH